MADVHNSDQRRFNMQQIKSKDTKPELLVRTFLHANGFRYSLHKKTLPGKPDIVLPKYKTVTSKMASRIFRSTEELDASMFLSEVAK